MPACVPIKDLRDTASFLKLVESESPRPVVVTRNGYDEFVVLSSSEYDRLCARAEMAAHYEALLTSEVQVQRGEVMPLDDAYIDGVFSDAL